VWRRHRKALTEAAASNRPFLFTSTERARTMGSRDGFVQGFVAAANEDLPATHAFSPPLHSAAAPVGRGGIVITPPPSCPAPGSPLAWGAEYAKLRFFEVCAAYTAYKEEKPWVGRLTRYTANATRATSHETAFLRQLFGRRLTEEYASMGMQEFKKDARASGMGLALNIFGVPVGSPAAASAFGEPAAPLRRERGAAAAPPAGGDEVTSSEARQKKARREALAARKLSVTAKLSRKAAKSDVPERPLLAQLVADMYSVCQIEANALGRSDHFCSLFEGPHLELLAKNELLRDLGDFYKQGAADKVAFASSCLLLEDFLTAGDAGAGIGSGADTAASRAVARAGGAPAAHFRFGHSESVMPFISVLGLYQEPAAPSLEEYYHAELARGTNHLLNSTRTRLRQLEAVYGLSEGEGSSSAVASASAAPCSGKKGCNKDDGRKGKGGKGGKVQFTTIPSSRDRALPPGFNEPLLMALKHPWSGARLIPMAANLQWLMYDCGDGPSQEEVAASGTGEGSPVMTGTWVKLMHNEREVGFPACLTETPEPEPGVMDDGARDDLLESHQKPSNPWAAPFGRHYPCPWSRVKEYYRGPVYAKYGITTCDAQDWGRLCGGLSKCESDRSS